MTSTMSRGDEASAATSPPLLDLHDVVVEHRSRGRTAHAVSGVTLAVRRGETLGLVGESGCGKSTLARAIVMLTPPTSGSIVFDGRELTTMSERELRAVRPEMQMIFQDPISSLHPRRRARDIVREGSIVWDRRITPTQVEGLLRAVGLDPDEVGDRRSHQLSGGQCQRLAIARSVALDPSLLVCDEPVSALDVSVQAQILNLLREMKERYSLTLLFIAHDLAVVRNVSDRVAVMYLGKIVELAPVGSLYASPRHPYTAALLESVPQLEPDVVTTPLAIRGEVPSAFAPPAGCRFRTRCPRAQERCAAEEPVLAGVGAAHSVACHYPLEEPGR